MADIKVPSIGEFAQVLGTEGGPGATLEAGLKGALTGIDLASTIQARRAETQARAGELELRKQAFQQKIKEFELAPERFEERVGVEAGAQRETTRQRQVGEKGLIEQRSEATLAAIAERNKLAVARQKADQTEGQYVVSIMKRMNEGGKVTPIEQQLVIKSLRNKGVESLFKLSLQDQTGIVTKRIEAMGGMAAVTAQMDALATKEVKAALTQEALVSEPQTLFELKNTIPEEQYDRVQNAIDQWLIAHDRENSVGNDTARNWVFEQGHVDVNGNVTAQSLAAEKGKASATRSLSSLIFGGIGDLLKFFTQDDPTAELSATTSADLQPTTTPLAGDLQPGLTSQTPSVLPLALQEILADIGVVKTEPLPPPPNPETFEVTKSRQTQRGTK